MRAVRGAGLLAALALAAAACGGSGDADETVIGSKAHVSLPPGEPTEVPDPFEGLDDPAMQPSPGQTPAAPIPAESAAPLPTDVNGIRRAPLEVVMGSTCVTPGALQKITVRAPAGFDVAWATLWPDGEGHQEWKGWSTGKMPEGGEYSAAFTVPPNAPVGEARTDVTVAGKMDDGEWAARMAHPFWEIRTTC